MRILFHVPSRRGLGHAMRASTLIRAIRVRDPGARCLLAVSHALPGGLLDPEAPCAVVGPAAPGAPLDLGAVRGFGADVIVFDTVVPDAWALLRAAAGRPGARLALVLREARPAALAALRAHPVVRELGLILVPHLREEFDPGLTGAVHVGPVARRRGATGGGDNPAPSFDILSTAGGGGHRELCEPFVGMVLAADRELRRWGLEPRHLLVTGPRYSGAVPDPGPVTVRRFAPDLPELIARARVVVSRAGYNTVAEIQAAGTPAILVPGDPGLDDQRGRARRLAAAGLAEVVEPGDVEGLVEALRRRLVAAGTGEASAAQAGSADPAADFTLGAALAAARLLALAGADVAHV
jgi:hypothetical protein